MSVNLSKELRDQILMVGLKNAFANCVAEVRTGTQPTDANSAATGVVLGYITVDGGTFTPGSPTNGLNFGTSVDGVIGKATDEVWKLTVTAAGTAGHIRFKANAVDNGLASTTLSRMDMSVGTIGADFNFGNVNLTVGQPITIDTFDVTLLAE